MQIINLDGLIQLQADKGKILTTLVPSSLRAKLLYTNEKNKNNYIEIDEPPKITLPDEPNIEEPEEILDGLTLAEAYYALLNENRVLQEKNKEQDKLINIALIATDQIYCLLEPLLANMIVDETAVKPLVNMYTSMVERGLKTIEEIPARYKKEVETTSK